MSQKNYNIFYIFLIILTLASCGPSFEERRNFHKRSELLDSPDLYSESEDIILKDASRTTNIKSDKINSENSSSDTKIILAQNETLNAEGSVTVSPISTSAINIPPVTLSGSSIQEKTEDEQISSDKKNDFVDEVKVIPIDDKIEDTEQDYEIAKVASPASFSSNASYITSSSASLNETSSSNSISAPPYQPSTSTGQSTGQTYISATGSRCTKIMHTANNQPTPALNCTDSAGNTQVFRDLTQ